MVKGRVGVVINRVYRLESLRTTVFYLRRTRVVGVLFSTTFPHPQRHHTREVSNALSMLSRQGQVRGCLAFRRFVCAELARCQGCWGGIFWVYWCRVFRRTTTIYATCAIRFREKLFCLFLVKRYSSRGKEKGCDDGKWQYNCINFGFCDTN